MTTNKKPKTNAIPPSPYGSGGGGSSTGSEQPTSAQCNTICRLYEFLCEGEIEGPAIDDNWYKSTYFNEISVMSSDGTLNFQGVSIHGLTGTYDQTGFEGLDDYEDGYLLNTQLYYNTPVTRSITNTAVTSLTVVIAFSAFYEILPEEHKTTSCSVSYKIEMRQVGGSWVEVLTHTQEGYYPRETPSVTHIINNIPSTYGEGPWEIQVTRLTEDSASQYIRDFSYLYSISETYLEGGNEQSSVTNIGTLVEYGSPISHSVTDTNVNHILVTIGWQALYESQDDGGIKEVSVDFKIEIKPYDGSWVEVGTYNITEKFNSQYQRDYKIDHLLNTYGPGPWTVRVSRLTEDSESVKINDKMYFYSVTEIIEEYFSYPNSVVVKYVFDAKEFGTSAPTRTTKIKGLKVNYPSNYDPNTRVYSGAWDGNMDGFGYTNNPAWFIYALLTNDTWGMGLDPSYVDTAALYQVAQYCDQMVTVTKREYMYAYNIEETEEPRFTLNLNLEQRNEALQVLKDVCGACRCYPLWYGSYVTFIQDRPYEGNIMIASASNVEAGLFTYGNTAMDVQHNTVEVTYNNDDNFGNQTTVSVSEDTMVATHGTIKKSVTLLGCNKKTEALRRAKYILYTDLYETKTVQFTGGIEWIASKPGDVIAVQDEFWAGVELSGRVVSSTTTSVTVDRTVTIESGKTYTLKCQSTTGDVFEKELTNTVGNHTTLYWSGVVSDQAPVDGVWVIEVSDLSLQYFRIISIVPGTGSDCFKYAISGVTYDENKYTAVEGDFHYDAPNTMINTSGVLLPPTNFTISPYSYTDGDSKNTKYGMLLGWEHSPDERRVNYELQSSYNNGAYTTLASPTSNSYDYKGVAEGIYDFRVKAVGFAGSSTWLEYNDYNMGCSTDGTLPPTGLQVKGGGTIWSGRDCEIEWTASSGTYYKGELVGNANVAGYQIHVRKQDGTQLRVANTGKNETYYTYTYDMNNTDNNGNPQRVLRFDVYTKDVYGNLSDDYATGVFTNIAPDMSSQTPNITAGPTYLLINWTTPPDTDLSHYVVYCNGTNPPTTSGGTVIPYPAHSMTMFGLSYGTTYYVSVYPYDEFGVGIQTQIGTGSPTLIPQEAVDTELQNSVIYTDSLASSESDLKELYDGVWNSGGIYYSGSWAWAQAYFGLEDYINGIQVWASDAANVCVSVSPTSSGNDWKWFGGNASHELELSDGVYRLTEYTNEADAKTNYWLTTADFDYAFLPNNITARRCRLHINSPITLHELVFRRIVISEDMAVEYLSAISANIGDITAGIIQSSDYTANTGFAINLNVPEILFGGATGSSLSYSDATGLVVNGQISFTAGTTGYSNITDIPTTLSDINATEGTKLDEAFTNAAQAIADAATAQDTADGKIKAFYQTTAPSSGMYVGDLWFDTDDGKKLYRYSGSSWVNIQDSDIAQAIDAAQTAQSTADGKAYVYYSSSTPSGATVGDLWYDTDDTYKRLYRYNGSSWQVVGSYGATWGTNITNQPTSLVDINSAEYSRLPGAAVGAIAYLNSISSNNITSITGDKIQTGVIYGNNSYSYWDLTNNRMYFTASADVEFAANCVVSFGAAARIEGAGGEYIAFNSDNILMSSTTGAYLYLYNSYSKMISDGNASIVAGSASLPIDDSVATTQAACVVATKDIYINPGTSYKTYIRFGSTNKIQINQYGMRPVTSNNMILGDSGYYWASCYATTYYDNGGGYNDLHDDLAIMAEYKPLKKVSINPETGKKFVSESTIINTETGGEHLDILSLPRWMTNYDEVVTKLKEDSCWLLTDNDISELIEDHEEAGWLLARNVSRYNDLTSGAVRQLDSEMIQMFELMADRVTTLEKRIKELEKLLK